MHNQFEDLLDKINESSSVKSTKDMTDKEYRDFIKKRTRQSMGGNVPDEIIDDAMKAAWKSPEGMKLDAERKRLRKEQGIRGNIISQTARGEDEVTKQIGDLSLRYTEEAIDKYIAQQATTELPVKEEE